VSSAPLLRRNGLRPFPQLRGSFRMSSIDMAGWTELMKAQKAFRGARVSRRHTVRRSDRVVLLTSGDSSPDTQELRSLRMSNGVRILR
jgi:hypothetical protein